MFMGAAGKPLPFREAVASGISVGVPGAVPSLELAHKQHGREPWADLFKPAIALARDGFPVSRRLAAWLDLIKSFGKEPAAQAIFFNADGSPHKQGDRISNPALADSMQLVAEQGAKALLQGPIAAEMVSRVQTHARPGTLSLNDLASYRVMVRDAVCGPYRVWTICGMPPPSSGGVAILQALGLLEPFELWREQPNSLRSLHLVAEASRLAFADRAHFIADPAFVNVPMAKLISPDYIAERRKLISPDRAMSGEKPVPAGYIEHGTSHMTIVDRNGNAVAFTTTIEAPFGAQMMVRGFILNNELTDFSAEPERDGKPVANRVEPGKRPRSSMAPTFVLDKDGRLVVALGSAGGQRIIGDVLQALIGMLDWNLSAQAALDLPRVANMNGPTELENKGSLPAQADALRALGHDARLRAHEGGLTAIRRAGDGWDGGADPRRDGVAKGE
jgi:gamma-glutamyltranspeptidase/glutathione hydrolase